VSVDEEALRAIVREVVARHLAGRESEPPAAGPPAWKGHASHVRLAVSSGRQLEGPCLIEPAVACHHCGYCQSYGH
jgi:hypothetical protein